MKDQRPSAASRLIERDGLRSMRQQGTRLLLLILIPLFARSAQGVPAPKQSKARPEASISGNKMNCRKLQLTGEVKAGESWSAPIAQGWTFRILPIAPSDRGYSGWDLVVAPPLDNDYPDALLLGTPPYGSLTEREIGTTFGLRAQDAIAWEPRRFHFLNSVHDVNRARNLYRKIVVAPSTGSAKSGSATSELLSIVGPGNSANLSAGQFKILDARLTTGTADPAPYARQWAMHLHEVPHEVIQPDPQSNKGSSSRGELQWIRFEVELWLPVSWQNLKATPSTCGQ